MVNASTRKTYTIEDFLDVAFNQAGLSNFKNYIFIDPEFYRPCEVNYLRGDCSKAKNALGWKPKYNLEGLVRLMLDAKL